MRTTNPRVTMIPRVLRTICRQGLASVMVQGGSTRRLTVVFVVVVLCMLPSLVLAVMIFMHTMPCTDHSPCITLFTQSIVNILLA